MAETLFRTDGYRGVYDSASQTGINAPTFERLAFEFCDLLNEQTDQSSIVIIGSDTRPSSELLRLAAGNGAMRSGAEVWDLGVSPTPVIAHLAKQHQARAIAITASHNPADDNGMKLFDNGGNKLTSEVQAEIEGRYYKSLDQPKLSSSGRGRRVDRAELQNEYLRDVVTKLGGDEALKDTSVVIDGANGAAHELAPRLYRALGAEVIEFACVNDGANINNSCGAAKLEGVRNFMDGRNRLVTSNGFLGAFASDGDGDRVMGVDALGRAVNGNHWLRRLAAGQHGIVGTIYTNTALRRRVEAMGVEFIECANGDSSVTAKLKELTQERGLRYTRGGEFTGHLIDLDHLSSGDGLFMGALMATKLAHEGGSLADVYNELKLWAEKMKEVRLEGSDAKAMVMGTGVQEAISQETQLLGSAGRIIVRASGTEPIVRVWAEAEDSSLVDGVTDRLVQALQAA